MKRYVNNHVNEHEIILKVTGKPRLVFPECQWHSEKEDEFCNVKYYLVQIRPSTFKCPLKLNLIAGNYKSKCSLIFKYKRKLDQDLRYDDCMTIYSRRLR